MSLTLTMQIITLLVVLLVPATVLQTKPTHGIWCRPTRWTLIYCAAYLATHLLSNAWWLIYWGYVPVGSDLTSLQGARYIMAVKFYTLHAMILVIMYLGIHVYATTRHGLPKHDLQAKMVLVILLIAEAFAAIEYVECKVFEPGDVAVAKTLGVIPPEYACQRSIGVFAPFAAPLVTSCYLIWINISAWKQRANS